MTCRTAGIPTITTCLAAQGTYCPAGSSATTPCAAVSARMRCGVTQHGPCELSTTTDCAARRVTSARCRHWACPAAPVPVLLAGTRSQAPRCAPTAPPGRSAALQRWLCPRAAVSARDMVALTREVAPHRDRPTAQVRVPRARTLWRARGERGAWLSGDTRVSLQRLFASPAVSAPPVRLACTAQRRVWVLPPARVSRLPRARPRKSSPIPSAFPHDCHVRSRLPRRELLPAGLHVRHALPSGESRAGRSTTRQSCYAHNMSVCLPGCAGPFR
jgi:hypothetical protein